MIEIIIGQLRTAGGVLNANLDGVDHAASLHQPAPGGNCINWIVGHLIASYDNLLPVIGGEPVLTAEQKARYDRGTAPLLDSDQAIDFDELRQHFATSQDRVIEALSQFPEDRLKEPAPFSPGNNPEETLGSLISVFAFHKAYHVGQTGLGRRLVGLDGALP